MTDPPEPARRLCCARMDHMGWCNLPDNHQGPHEGPARELGPVLPPPDVMLRRRQRREAQELAERVAAPRRKEGP